MIFTILSCGSSLVWERTHSIRFLCAFDNVDEFPLPILPILEIALGFTSLECIGTERGGLSIDSGGTISLSRDANAIWRSSIVFPASCSFALRFIRFSCDLEKCLVLGPNSGKERSKTKGNEKEHAFYFAWKLHVFPFVLLFWFERQVPISFVVPLGCLPASFFNLNLKIIKETHTRTDISLFMTASMVALLAPLSNFIEGWCAEWRMRDAFGCMK